MQLFIIVIKSSNSCLLVYLFSEILITLFVLSSSPIALITWDGSPRLHADPVDIAILSLIYLMNISLLKFVLLTKILIIPFALIHSGIRILISSKPRSFSTRYSSSSEISLWFASWSRIAISAALPTPTILCTASVPARIPLSCSPPWSRAVIGGSPYLSAFIYAQPIPFGP